MESIYEDMKAYIMEQVSSKIYDSNTAHHRKYCGTRRDFAIGGCHRLVLQDVFGEENNHSQFETLSSLKACLPKTFFGRIHSRTNDVSIASPIGVLALDFQSFQKGTLVLPLEGNFESTRCFFPYGGPIDDEDLPEWVQEVNAESITEFDVDKCRKIEETVVASKTDLDYFTCKAGIVKEGDHVFFHGERAKVIAVAPSFDNPLNETIRVKDDFKHKHKQQSIKIFRPPTLRGMLATVPSFIINTHCPFIVQLNSKGNVGDVNICYQNFIFNELGFLTHDTVISVI